MKTAILYFVKYPEPGKVKTRLAKSIGDELAAKFYQNLAEKNFKVICDVANSDTIVVFDPPQNEGEMRQWLKGATSYRGQSGDGLGERLEFAFREAFASGYQKVIAVGSDIIDMNSEIIHDAFNRLEQVEVVVGPAKDGGYYLLGTHRHYPQLFSHISWSTSLVFQQTNKIIADNNLSVSCLESLDDLDEIKQQQ